MDIHYSENTLEENNNSCENIEENNNNTHDNLKEMNPYVDKNDDIHSQETDDNNVMDIQESKDIIQPINVEAEYFKANALMKFIIDHNKKIHAKQLVNKRRNEIMRIVEREPNGTNPTVKQMIKAGTAMRLDKNDHKHRLDILRNKSSINPNKSGNFISKHSTGGFIRPTPSVSIGQFTPQQPHIFVDNYQLRSDPVNPNIEAIAWMNNASIIDSIEYKKTQLAVEKPKEVNLAEIVTTVLQDILAGKLTTVETIIGNLRIIYEEKSVFTNSKKRNIILLNFEDDTMRPVLKIEDKYMEIIQKWYQDCDLLIDIEETNVSIPENITVQDVSGVLFQDISYKYKEEYLNNYIPLIINNIISKHNIKDFERKCFVKPMNDSRPVKVLKYASSDLSAINLESKEITNPQENSKLKELGIIIPANIFPFTKKEEQNKSSTRNSEWFADSPWVADSSRGMIDTEIVNKYIVDKTYIYKTNKVFETEPYNIVTDYEQSLFDVSNNLLPKSYTNEYNCLNSRFSENSALVDETISEENNKSKSDSIYVLMNDKFLQTITIKNPEQNIMHIIKNHPEFGFIKLFDFVTSNIDIIHFIEREFDKTSFNDIEEVNKKLLVTSQYIDFSNKQNDSNVIASTEENQVKKLLNSKYTITDDINNKMKASTLYDIIINSKFMKIDSNKIAGFRTRLSKYLKDLGLQKKRYNDGFYYYGIVEKAPLFNDHKSLNIKYEEMQRKRKEEEKGFIFNENNFSKH